MAVPLTEHRACPRCGSPADAAGRFCGTCGGELATVALPPTEPLAGPPAGGPVVSAPTEPLAPPPAGGPAISQPWPLAGGPVISPPASPGVPVDPATGWYPARSERTTPAALLAAIGALLVVAFAGAAVAVILAVSRGDSVATTSGKTGATTITVITHGQ